MQVNFVLTGKRKGNFVAPFKKKQTGNKRKTEKFPVCSKSIKNFTKIVCLWLFYLFLYLVRQVFTILERILGCNVVLRYIGESQKKNVRSDPRKLWMLAKISSKTKASGITEADTENESA